MSGRGASPTATDAWSLGVDMWLLGMESAAVIGLRTLKFAAGGAAARTESDQMITEKISALVELPLALVSSGSFTPEALADCTLRHYSQLVRANRRRLSQPSNA